EYPHSFDELLRDSRIPGLARHLRKVFVDPMTGKTDWGMIKIGGRIVGVYSHSRQKPIKQGNFEPDQSQFEGATTYSDWVFTYPADLLLKPSNFALPEQIPEKVSSSLGA
ncbi:MAG: hypothetical protein LBL69_06930, partial [Zoogloeaceae bacterium]|nr:hypothetical protein [Zoogloeaceae bacterium]